jgi:RpiR family carbohydrate utilization transcriptional regulator
MDRIRQSLTKLSRAERQVADWVLAHPRETTESTLAQVARQSRTSEPTVIRFCRRIGFDGFRELTLRLIEALSRPDRFVHLNVNADDAISDATTKVVDSAIRSLVELRSQLSTMPFEEILRAMVVARQIVFAGLGASGHVAGDACHKLFRLGTPCSALTDTPSIQQFAAIAGPRDVLIIISKIGGSAELCQSARDAVQNGATVVAVTAGGSRLAYSASYLLSCSAEEDTNLYTPMSSRIVHLGLLDALQVALALTIGETAATNLKRSKEALRQHGQMPKDSQAT